MSGRLWEGTGRVPELPGACFWFRPIFGYEVGPGGRRLLRLETKVGLRGRRLDGVVCPAPLRSGALPRPPCSNCTLLHTATRPPITQPAQETVLGSAVPSLATPPAPCFQGIRSGLRQVRFRRKLMPGEGFYMNVLCYLLKAWKRCAATAAIATYCHDSICALLASRLSRHDLAVLCCTHILQVSAFCPPSSEA